MGSQSFLETIRRSTDIITNMKFISILSYFITIVFINGCTSGGKNFRLKSFGIGTSSTLSQGILISCYRCTCVDDFLISSEYAKIKKKNVLLFLDSSCKKNIKDDYLYISQKKLDSIYLQNYNMMFFRYDNSKQEYIISLQKTDNNFVKEYLTFFKD